MIGYNFVANIVLYILIYKDYLIFFHISTLGNSLYLCQTMSSGNMDINAPILPNEFPDVFDLLLKDCTSSTKRHQRNIIWGSDIRASYVANTAKK